MLREVKTTYLELLAEDEFRPSTGFREIVEVKEVDNDAFLNFVLFAGVGLPWRWHSRLRWTMEEWDEYFNKGEIFTFLGFVNKRLAGYYELDFTRPGEAEIKFFGILPGLVGRGLGGKLLSHAVESARAKPVKRIWLHTCSNDSETALSNYLARGFRVYREELNVEDVPEIHELVHLTAEFFKKYLERYPPL